jgi:hypothetical protein
MAIKIKADREEFALATDNGAVYGKVIRATAISVYVELGRELRYNPSPRDDENAEYKQFSGCTIYYAETDEQLDRGEYLNITKDSIVVIYY